MANDRHNAPPGTDVREHHPANINGAVSDAGAPVALGVDYATIASAVGGKGWSTLIDIAALTGRPGGRPGGRLVMKPIRMDDLQAANTND